MFGDPRLQQTWNNITAALETLNASLAATLYSAHTACLGPCLTTLSTTTTSALDAACPCCLFLSDSDHARGRRRARTGYSRLQQSFDFYDEWDDEEVLTDELDGLLARSRAYRGVDWGGRGAGMSYGAAGRPRAGDERADPNIVPKSNVFGFLERVPFVGSRGVRYKPSAADLQDNPGGRGKSGFGHLQPEDEAVEGSVSQHDGSDESKGKRHKRTRSGTVSSGNTQETLSSRGDLFPSSDEEDAALLDDELSLALRTKSNEAIGSTATGNMTRPSLALSRQSRRSKREPRSAAASTLGSVAANTPNTPQFATPEVLAQPQESAADAENQVAPPEDPVRNAIEGMTETKK